MRTEAELKEAMEHLSMSHVGAVSAGEGETKECAQLEAQLWLLEWVMGRDNSFGAFIQDCREFHRAVKYSMEKATSARNN